jgi:uncharacterized protein involved in outer membrane biogenesis
MVVAAKANSVHRRWPYVVGAVIILLILFVALFNWNWLKGPIERRVTASTGREFRIAGDLDVDLGLQTKVRLNDVSFANAAWSQHPQMLTLKRIEVRIKLLPLLHGQLDLPFVDVDAPHIVVERNEQGVGNWVLDTPDKQEKDKDEPTALPLVREIRVRDGQLQLIEPTYRTDVKLDVRSAKRTSGDARAPLIATGKGTYRDAQFTLEARVDSPLALRDAERPYHVDLKASAGATHAHISGALQGQLQFEDFKVKTDASGSTLADLYKLAGVALPETPPYSLSGELNRHGNVWSYRGFKGKIGASDMRGDVAVELAHAGHDRMKLTGDLVSNRLDFKDLGSLIGAPPPQDEGKALSAEQQQLAAQRDAGPRVLPSEPFKLDKLRVMDADVRLRATRIDAPKLPLEQMNVHAVLDNGVLRLNPLNFNAAGGTLATHVELNAREETVRTLLTADVEHLQLPLLLPKFKMTEKGAGDISGALALKMTGNNVADMFGSADGNIGLIMGKGHISNLMVELAGLDVAESIKYLIDKDREIPLRCAYTAFDVKDGVMNATGLAFDTTDTAIFGEGSIDMKQEKIALRLVPQPKDRSPLTIRVPLIIGGTFKDPSFHPEAKPLLARTAAAAALYTLAPPAALLALIETGPGVNIDCGVTGDAPPDKSGEKSGEAARVKGRR